MSDVLESGATGADPEPEPSESSAPSEGDAAGGAGPNKRRRRGTRGGRGRNRTRVTTAGDDDAGDDDQPELPDRPIEGKVQSPEVAERVLVRRPKIGDTRPAPEPPEPPAKTGKPAANGPRKRRRA